MSQQLILAIDQGGQSSRIAIYNTKGEQLHCFSSPCATQHYQSENSAQHFIEQNGEDILSGIKFCLHEIHVAIGSDLRYLCAAGFAGQGSSLLCWNKQTGQALTPVLSWQDVRGENILKNLSLTHTQAQAITGLRLSPHFGASKMRWCIENIPSVALAFKNNTLSIGPIVSYIFWHLLQQKNMVDPGHAQRTLLWNLQKNNWDNTLLELFNIPQSVLPECKFHNSDFGSLTLGGFQIPFRASARDQGASLFAQGFPDKNNCYINIGTGAFIQRVSEKLSAPAGLLVSPLWLPEGVDAQKLFCWEATVNGAASAIPFVQQDAGLSVTPEEITQALELNPLHSCYFLNAVGGLSAPYWRTDVVSRFSKNLSPYEKILAWLESVSFQIVINVELMNELGRPHNIIISGGLSNADGVCQKISDLTHAKVYRSDNADATLQGIANMAAGMPNEWLLQKKGSKIFMPQVNVTLQQRFDEWRLAMSEWLG